MMSSRLEKKFKYNLLVFHGINYVKICVFRAFDQPSSVSGWQVMVTKR